MIPSCNPQATLTRLIDAWTAERRAGLHMLSWTAWAARKISFREAGDHELSRAEWAAELAILDTAHYLDPPLRPLPSVVLTRRARVALLEERHARGEQLWHPLDLLPGKAQWLEVTVAIGHLDNGEDRDDETLTAN